MEHFLINSTACLFVLWLFYKVALENTSWHYWKRYYLVGALIISLIIPFIVVKTIVIPIEEIPFENYGNLILTESIVEKSAFTINWLYVISSIYVLGVFIMFWRFSKNLYSFRIKQEDEISSYSTYQLILRNSITIPHSFLKRIFISKKSYESEKIPNVVLEHEKAHLDQKHSLDILLIEILLVILWFNPLLYIIRYSIKLNHEFLADNAVLKQGISTHTYQEILLEHATNSYAQAMANTFNFPIIKKRFSIMKTNTSKINIVIRSLALIPILALLVISCGKEETEFQEVETSTSKKVIIVDPTDSEGNINIDGKPHFYTIKGNQVDIYNQFGELQDFESQGYEILIESELTDLNQQSIKDIELLESLIPEVENNKVKIYINQGEKTADELRNLIVGAKKLKVNLNISYENMKVEKIDGIKHLYLNGMSTTNPSLGNFLPPPPPTIAPLKDYGYIKVDGEIHYYSLKGDKKDFYDQWGNKIDVKGKTVEYLDQKNLPPPPPPASPIDYIENSGDRMNYYIDDEKVTADEAKAFIKKNGDKGVQIMPVNGVNSLKISTNRSSQNTIGWTKDFEEGFNAKQKSQEVNNWVRDVKNSTWKDVKKHLKESTKSTSGVDDYIQSYAIEITDDGKIYLGNQELNYTGVEKFINQISPIDKSNVYVFMGDKDYKTFAMKRKPNDIYLYVNARDFDFSNDELAKLFSNEKITPVKNALEHNLTKEPAIKLGTFLKGMGVHVNV